ncbi:hypothetical protein BURC_01243 [Burkholderiaceae bacterium]|nr:hypothetical protein BURC_01243 [Burkholderiaceae bacterium]
MNQPLRHLALAAALSAAANAHAVSDAAGDILPSFTGAPVGALDILAAEVSFDALANNFLLHARTAGPIAGADGVAYIFGFNRGGAANAPFGPIGVPGVSFNSTVTLRANGTAGVGATPIAAPTISDNDIFGVVSASLLPSNGLEAKDYTWALWAIDGNIAGLARNADFAPTSNVAVGAVPEPETYALMAAGLGMVAFAARRRRETAASR